MGIKIGMVSLGCAKNRVDAELMLGVLLSDGFELETDPAKADAIIVNTCGFIEAAKQESIDTILEMAEYKQDHLKALIVTGCLSKRYAKEIGKPYESLNLIVCHMGGGVSVGAHVKGEVVDTGNALEGEGPFSPERSGTLPSGALVDLCFSGKYTEQEIRRMITGNGGLLAYTGSTDMQELMRRAATDAKVQEVIDAFHYRVAKEIGAMAAAMKGQVDQIILTGGIAHGQETVDALKGYVSWIAPVTVYPGEGELLALAEGALRVLRGEETAKIYE